MPSLNQFVSHPILKEKRVSLYIKREDLNHPIVSGNKYRKLKYNLIHAKEKGFDTILTFGGAFSNHIAATAFAGKEHDLRTIGIIRGEELLQKWMENPTLCLAHDHGMQFKFVSREAYRDKESMAFIKELEAEFNSFYLLPEGGTNALAVKGCEEILNSEDVGFNIICCAVGTGGTIAGISNSMQKEQQVIGFQALKGDFLSKDICKFARNNNWELQMDYNFGGYAKVDLALIKFINEFKSSTEIPLDAIYTGKMMFGIFDMVRAGKFPPGTKILAIHTGGLQGTIGMNQVLKRKHLPLIEI